MIEGKDHLPEGGQPLEQPGAGFFDVPDALVCTADFDGYFTRLGRGWNGLLGYEPGDLLAHPFVEFVHPEDVEATTVAARRLAEREPVIGLENRYRASDGSYRWLRWNATAVHSSRTIYATATDVTAERDSEARAAAAGLRDDLTGLPNRAVFLDRVDYALALLDRRQSHVAVVVLDLDEFQSLNDTLGRGGGDELLQVVAARLTEVVRASDTIARVGADEFGVLCMDADETAVLAIAERLGAAVAQPLVVRGHSLVQTASTGIAVASKPRLGEMLMGDAELALHRASSSGPGRLEFFERELRADSAKRLRLREELRQAAGREELELDYQPVLAAADGRTLALEALIRWRHPTRGRLAPGEFIPLAEQSGLIESLGAWVLETACKEAKHWEARTNRPPAVAVNLSAHQLASPVLVDTVAHALESARLAPERLWLEVTESAVLVNRDDAIETFAILRRLGVQVALDDFGEGHSSLAQLKLLTPVSILKIGAPFVQGLGGTGVRDRAIVEAIVTLARTLGLKTVAEGVETEPQLALLKDLGCDAVQGFLLGRPASRESVREWL